MGINVAYFYYAVFESGHFGSNVGLNAFDASDTSKWEGTADNSWLAIDLGVGYNAKVNLLKLKPRSYSGAQCKDFIFYGSNDTTNGADGTWVQLTTGQHGNNENLEEFSFINNTSYRYYKILVDTSWRDDFAGGSFYTVQMFADDYHINNNYIPVPKMTAANLPQPFVASGSDNDSNQAPWMAFDGDISNFYYCDSGQSNNYLQIDIGEQITIEGYRYKQSTGGSNLNMASQFTLNGSNDGSTWEIIDTRTGLSTTRDVWQVFTLAASVSYRYFKLNNIYAQGYQETCLGEFEFIRAEEAEETEIFLTCFI